MAAGTTPIFPAVPKIGWGAGKLTAANTATDGTGTVTTLLQAGANGYRVERLRLVPSGTNVASVLRLFVNNNLTNATAANNTFIGEWALPATTANAAGVNGQSLDIELHIAIDALFKLNAVLGTAVAAGWAVTVIGGDY